ncbi:unnamed protein product [Acanthoscelides obtectus]|uniref:Uncharacterized protein n=1 Tax=Acanthoscelides obtectus TaxID=200917 RepID=A0A9P0L107_ACAOB|nr:unnamed protein product [Acanthoscelides obtectus]CAK1673111.1 hypothetical protein AOBTE_LOCUS29242 [Acanthoscelides obtectus]
MKQVLSVNVFNLTKHCVGIQCDITVVRFSIFETPSDRWFKVALPSRIHPSDCTSQNAGSGVTELSRPGCEVISNFVWKTCAVDCLCKIPSSQCPRRLTK